MNRYTLFALITLVAFITSCTTITTEIPKAPAKAVPASQTIFTKNAWLGMVGKNVTNGVEVADIYVNSPARDAGISKGDVIIASNGRTITNTESFLSAISRAKANDEVTLKVLRQEETIEIIDPASKTTTTVSKEYFLKKHQSFKDDGKPGDRMEFTALKKTVTKELAITLAYAPGNFHLIPPPKPLEEPQPEVKNGKKAGWMGVSMSPVKGLAKMGMGKDQGGIKINSISHLSPAEKAGLKTGDIVIIYDNNIFSGEESKYQDQMAEHIKSVGSGGIVSVTVLRAMDEIDLMINGKKELTEAEKIVDSINSLKDGDLMKAGITRSIKELELPVTLGTRMAAGEKPDVEPETNDQIHPELKDYTMPIEILAKRIISDTNITDKYEDLLKRYSEDQKWDDGMRIPNMRYMHRDPFKIPVICDTLLDDLQRYITANDLWAMMGVVISELDDDSYEFRTKLKTGISLQEHCQQLSELLDEAEAERKRAFAGLTDDDMAFIKDNIYGLTDRWILDNNLQDSEYNERDKKLLQLCSFINYETLFAAGKLLTGVLAPEYLDGLKNDIEREGHNKEGVLVKKDTSFGPIIINGKGNDSYQERAAIIIDIGGDDFYANQQGWSVYEPDKPDQPFGIIIDFAGNDRYSSYRYGCQGSGFMGVGILYDGSGDDIYIAQDWAQGSGLLGVGILLDADGEDSYKGQEYVQGAGLFGVGILIDRSKEAISLFANDSYQANSYAQGFAGPKAFGLLIDMAGYDNYLASTKHPNGYPDNPGTFDCWSQGCGTGMRAYTDPSMSRSGGIGVLIDQAGDDYYEAGTFSQGGGYYFGWGILADKGGNDKYLGTRYSQGFAAHSAIGYFMDESGNDQYKTLCGVVAGLSWDLTCVAFIDKAGNDIYDEGGFSRGATAHNGFCLFMDLGGKDIYNDSVAQAGDNSYHGGYSLSIFLDLGPEEDEYPNRKNNNIEVNTEYSIFIDTDREIEDLITDDSYQGILKNNIKEEAKKKK